MLNELVRRYPVLDTVKDDIIAAADMIIDCYENGGKVLVCGNGGSCADSEHIVGELMKGFLKKRPISDEQRASMKSLCPDISDEWLDSLQGSLPAIPLTSITGLNTAFCNDVDPELMYAQSIMGLGKTGDVVICISTSGNSKNVSAAAKVAKALGLFTVGLTGAGGGKLGEICDVCVRVPESETFKVQELHLPVYHYICAKTEEHFFDK